MNNTKDKVSLLLLNNKAIIILAVIVIGSAILTGGTTLTANNLGGIARQTSVAALMGMAMSLMLSLGASDLSLGFRASLIGVIYAIMSLNMPIWVAIILAIIIGALLNLLNGVITYSFNLPPFIVTLATAQIFQGVSFILVDGKSVTGLSDQVKYLGQGTVGPIPVSSIIMVAVIIFVAVLINKTKFGRHLLATGGNAEASRVSGIDTTKIRLGTFAIAGAISAIAAIVLTGRIGTALPDSAADMHLDAIAASVIGGTPMGGGKINVFGSFIGVLIMVFISNGMNLLNISSFWQYITKGLLLIFAIVLDAYTQKTIEKQQIVAK